MLTNRKQRVIIRGTCSEWSLVIPETPQGTILGPILFLLYVNDISDNVKSKIKLFADGIKMYREIKDPIIDTEISQSDLNIVSQWASNWQMRFNTIKCKVMRITHHRYKSVPNDHLEDTPLRVVHCVKYLGVNVSSDLSWNKHVDITVNKANKVLGVIKGTVGTLNQQVISTLYKSLVRPILEYAVPVWCPYLAKNIHTVEKFKDVLQDLL